MYAPEKLGPSRRFCAAKRARSALGAQFVQACSLTKSITKVLFSLHYNDNESYLHVNEMKICIFKGLDDISMGISVFYFQTLPSVIRFFRKFVLSKAVELFNDYYSRVSDEKCNVKRFLRIFQLFFVTLLSFRKSFSENVKYRTFFNRPCLQYVIDLNSDELRTLPFIYG